MRVAPVGLLYFDDPEELRVIAEKSSLITHAHPLGIEGRGCSGLRCFSCR